VLRLRCLCVAGAASRCTGPAGSFAGCDPRAAAAACDGLPLRGEKVDCHDRDLVVVSKMTSTRITNGDASAEARGAPLGRPIFGE